MTASDQPVRMGVLRDYPLRLWARQQQYTDELLREFALLLIGEESGRLHNEAPGRLLRLADNFTTTYGPMLSAITAERRQALDQGLDRMDSKVPLLDGLPGILEQIEEVLACADEYCRNEELLSFPRPPELIALFAWTRDELLKQYAEAGEPTAWPGPF